MAKGTDHFKRNIEAYLEKKATDDELFRAVYMNEDKNIDDCIKYIFNTVQKSGCNGFEDSEIYGMAMHYYDEKDIDVSKMNSSPRVVVNHVVKLTEEEKAEAKAKAIQQVIDDEKKRMTTKKKSAKVEVVKTEAPEEPQTSLF